MRFTGTSSAFDRALADRPSVSSSPASKGLANGVVGRSALWGGGSRGLPVGVFAFMFQEPTQRVEVDVPAAEVTRERAQS